MTRASWRWLSAVLGTAVGVVLLTLTTMMNAAFAFGEGTALIIGGTNMSVPPAWYVEAVGNTYIDPVQPGFPGQLVFPGYTSVGLITPEQFWPVTPTLGNMTFGQSVDQGVSIVQEAISQTYAGENLVVFGFSQSSTIVTNVMLALAEAEDAPDPSQLAFILIANPNTPNGGILERFVGSYIPILDVAFNGATPPDTVYNTAIYSSQYDAIDHFPQFLSNPLALINSLFGYALVHGAYPWAPEGLSAFEQLAVSPDYDGVTDYFMLTHQDLPLLEPLRLIPYLGPFLAELVQPALRVLIDLGYGDGYANVPTPVDLFPLFNPLTVGEHLIQGLSQGWQAALVSAGVLAETYLPDAYPYLPSADPLLATSLWNLLNDNSQLGWEGLLGFDPAEEFAWFPSMLDALDWAA